MCVEYMYRNIHYITDDEDYEILRHPFNDVTSSELLTFTILSSGFPISTNARPVIAIIIPGGTIHHQRPLDIAPAA